MSMKKAAIMKAVVYERYGPPEVLQIKDLPKPEPAADEVLIKVCATTVHVGDTRMRKPDPQLARLVNGIFRPIKIPVLGLELAGMVEAIGADVQLFKVGDEVFAFTGFRFGAYAEYICLPEDPPAGKSLLAHKPINLSFELAAAVPGGGLTALAVMRKADIKPGQTMLIYGASGSVGSYGLQLAKHFGAEVTAVCSTANLDMVKSLGADHIVDYTRENFLEKAQRYDLVFDAVDKLPQRDAKKVLKPDGKYLNVARDSGSPEDLRVENLQFLTELIEAGELSVAVDRAYPLEDIVAAHRYVDQGHKKGNVVIRVSPEGEC